MSIEKLPSGKYRDVRPFKGVKRATKAYDTLDEARLAGARLMLDMGAHSSNGSATLDELLDARLADGDELAASIRDDYTRLVRKLRSSAPPILSREVRSIEPYDIDQLYRSLARSGDWTAHRIDKLHDVMGSSFARALRWGWVRYNPTHGVAPPPPATSDVRPPTDAQVKTLATKSTGLVRLAVLLASRLGLRRGEIVALQWSDFDWKRNTLRVQRSLSYSPAEGIVTGDTKTGRKGHRTLTLRGALLAEIKAHRKTQAAQALADGLTPVWLFSDSAGVEPWRPDRLTHEFENVAVKANGSCRFHDLRHYCATSLLLAGVPVKVVSQMLGHSSSSTTEAVYAHWIPGADAEAAEIMAAKLG